MKIIKVNSKAFGTQNILVDDQDFDLVSRLSWMLIKGRTGVFYAVARHYYKDNHRKLVKMHSLIMGEQSDKLKIDHIDGNGINNQRYNLRICTNSQNLWNRGKSSVNTTGFKGVSPLRYRSKKFQVQIQVNNKNICGGHFYTAEEAALRYNELARQYHGEFAYQNTI